MWGALSDERTGLPLQLLLVLASAVILGSVSLGTRSAERSPFITSGEPNIDHHLEQLVVILSVVRCHRNVLTEPS
jgi:hypothetical protein